MLLKIMEKLDDTVSLGFILAVLSFISFHISLDLDKVIIFWSFPTLIDLSFEEVD